MYKQMIWHLQMISYEVILPKDSGLGCSGQSEIVKTNKKILNSSPENISKATVLKKNSSVKQINLDIYRTYSSDTYFPPISIF